MSAHPRARVRRDRSLGGAGFAGRARDRHRRGRAGQSLSGAHLSRLAAVRRRRRGDPLHRRRPVRDRRRRPRAGPPRRAARPSRVSGARADHLARGTRSRPGAPLLHPENGHADNLLSTSKTTRGDVEGALKKARTWSRAPGSTQFIEHAFLEPESCLAVPPGRIDLDGKPSPNLHVYSQGQGVYDDHRQIASALSARRRHAAGHAGELRRRVRRQRGSVDPGADGAAGAGAGAPVKLTIDRGRVDPHPSQAPSDHHDATPSAATPTDRLTAVRARMIGDKGAYASVGCKVHRARLRARDRRLRRAERRHRGARGLHQQSAVRRDARLRRQPVGVRRSRAASTCSPRSSGIDAWEIRWRNALVDGSTLLLGPDAATRSGCKKTLEAVKPHYDAAQAAGRSGRARLRHQERRHRQRHARHRPRLAHRREGRHHHARQRLHRDGPGALHGADPDGVATCTGIDPRRFRATVDTARRRAVGHDHRVAGDGVRRARRGRRGREAQGRSRRGHDLSRAGRPHATSASSSTTRPPSSARRSKIRSPTSRSATPPSSRSSTTEGGSSGWSPRTTSAA